MEAHDEDTMGNLDETDAIESNEHHFRGNVLDTITEVDSENSSTNKE